MPMAGQAFGAYYDFYTTSNEQKLASFDPPSTLTSRVRADVQDPSYYYGYGYRLQFERNNLPDSTVRSASNMAYANPVYSSSQYTATHGYRYHFDVLSNDGGKTAYGFIRFD